MLKYVKIRKDEVGLLFKDDLFERILRTGTYWFWTLFQQVRVEVVSTRERELMHEQIDEMVRYGKFGDLAEVVEVEAMQKGLLWVNGELERVLSKGNYIFWNRMRDADAELLDERSIALRHDKLVQIANSGLLNEFIEVVDLNDRQRALVWLDGRVYAVLGSGLHAFWKTQRDIKVDVYDIESLRFEHRDLEEILRLPTATAELDVVTIAQGFVGVLYRNGKYVETLNAGRYTFWKRVDRYEIVQVDKRESHLDIVGQDIMTEDKVTLRMNAIVTWQVVDAVRFVSVSDNSAQALYRAAQLVLRSFVCRVTLDDFLSDKEALANQLVDRLAGRAKDWGIHVHSAGIRDVILPGEMKDLLNKVTEAKKAAEANLIARREETAAMRSQVNTAKLLENNATLMRLRELEALEAISKNTSLQVLLGETGLADKVVKML